MFSTSDLQAPLQQREISLSSSQVYRLVVDRPERLSLKILMALLDILDCTMEDLIEPVAAAEASAPKAAMRRQVSASCGRDVPGSPASDLGRTWAPARSRTWSRGDHRTGRAGRDRLGLGGVIEEIVAGFASTSVADPAAGARCSRTDASDPDRHGRSPAPAAAGDLLIALREPRAPPRYPRRSAPRRDAASWLGGAAAPRPGLVLQRLLSPSARNEPCSQAAAGRDRSPPGTKTVHAVVPGLHPARRP